MTRFWRLWIYKNFLFVTNKSSSFAERKWKKFMTVTLDGNIICLIELKRNVKEYIYFFGKCDLQAALLRFRMYEILKISSTIWTYFKFTSWLQIKETAL